MNIGTDELRQRLAIPAGWLQLGLAAAALYFGTPQAIADEPTAQSAGPLVVTPKGDDAVVKMSLRQWNSYWDRRERQKIEAAKQLAPEGLELPKGPVESSEPLALWSTTEVKGLATDPAGQGHTTELGAALKLGRDWKLGVGTERREDQAQEQLINRAGLQTRLDFNDWKLLPQATIVDEHTTSHGGAAGSATPADGSATSTTSTRLELAPELRRPMKLENGDVLEPFVNFTSQIGLDSSDAEKATAGDTIDKVGIGLNLSRPDEYKLEATADFDGLGEGESREVNSRVKLTVPLD